MSASLVQESLFLPAMEYITNPRLKAPILRMLDTLFKDKMEDLTIDKGPEKITVMLTLHKPYHRDVSAGSFSLPKRIHFEVAKDTIFFPDRHATPLETERGYIQNGYFYWKQISLFKPGAYMFMYERVTRVLIFEEVRLSVKIVNDQVISQFA